MSRVKGVPYSNEVVDYFVRRHMKPFQRPFRGCLPRDILDLVVDSCRFRQTAVTITPKLLDEAAEAYFVRLEDRLQNEVP